MRKSGTYPIFAAAILSLSALGAQAQDYPARAVQMLLGFSAGGSVDIMARGVAEEMSSILGQRVIVMNRESASGVVAMSAVASAKPDGYLLGVGPATPITNVPHVQKLAYNSLDEILPAARKEPGKLTYGDAGHASIPHLAAVETTV